MNVKIEDTQAEPSTSPLGEINKIFHQGYATNKQQFKQKITNGDILLIVRMDSRLISLCANEVSEYIINDTRYQKLKAVTHTTLAAYYTLLQQPVEDAIPLIRNWLTEIADDNSEPIFTDVVDTTRQFLLNIEQSGAIMHTELMTYTKKLEPIYARLLMQSAEDEVARLVEQLQIINQRYKKPPSDIFFVVFGGHQSRYRELAKLVFTKWYADTDDHILDADHHIKYSEGGKTLDDAVDLVATAMADRELAQTFLGNSQGLNQDVLGIVAKKAIERFWQRHSHLDASSGKNN
ncbi:hypothetical protein [Neptunicella sp. SCSIO 80796]|uniref:hypothetical protein n=1 Tax=Neptunicella plasticusilytica TaxID=3117012 RepID=UPI003A4D711C